MQVGVISDVHGNLVALEAVLAEMPDVDALVNAGDVVGYNPWHCDCVAAMAEPASSPAVPDRLGEAATAAGGSDTATGGPGPAPGGADAAGVPTVMGNHDRAVATDSAFRFNAMAAAGVEHAREQLGEDALAWLAGLPDERVLLDGRLKVVHGHPDDPDHYTRPHEFHPDLLRGEDALVMGHTHVQHHETYEEGVVLNPGSVGQPRDGDPRAAYAVLDLDSLEVAERRVEYDVERVQRRVREEGLPDRIGARLAEGR